MNLKLTFLILSSAVVVFLGSANADDDREQKLAGEWEVVSVDRDGIHRHGEVGQAPGDVISINFAKDVLVGKSTVESAAENTIVNNLLPVMPHEFNNLQFENSNAIIFS